MDENQLLKISENTETLLKKHNLFPDNLLLQFIYTHHEFLGILAPSPKIKEYEVTKHYLGEYYALMSKTLGIVSARLLYKSKWNAYSHPEWFDHRISALFPECYDAAHVSLSGIEIFKKIPLDGEMLSLCSGDGFYEYRFYSQRAQNIDCI